MGYYEVSGEGLIIDCDDEKEQNDKVRDINEDDEGEILFSFLVFFYLTKEKVLWRE